MAGTGSTDNGSFTIVGNTLKSAAVFDFEAKKSYSVRVMTTDQGGLSFEQVFAITVMDKADGPSIFATAIIPFVVNNTTLVTGLSVVDPLAGAKRLTTTLSVPDGNMTIGTKTGLVFLAGDGLADATIKFTGTLAQTNTALKSLSYISALDKLVATNVTISTQRDNYTPSRVAIRLAVAENRIVKITEPAPSKKVSVLIQGTSYNDTITVQPVGTSITNYTVTVNGATTSWPGITGWFIVYGLDGDDVIDLKASKVAVKVDGGIGNDVILGGTVADVLFGADGADFIAGGLGADTIDGGSGNDILVDGSASVRTGVGKTLSSILDGWALLTSPVEKDYAAITSDIVFTADKQSKDTLTGGIGIDWFWSATAGAVADTIDKITSERRRLL